MMQKYMKFFLQDIKINSDNLSLSKLTFQKNDPIVDKLYESTEEGQKVTRNNGEKFLAVFRRMPDIVHTE